ncbi:glycosyltransferase family 2 protein [Paenibacillus sp. GCM10012307]|uniref:Glycosyltransferase family 2 protein n=1 Tax=Paenibacillus roseus TaxID=2798579 RepID=A0A934JBL4_9BACL|nr:glycosyltransferase family 2 protein [Paenibacillus roseus]MBJ6363823.1 glycosyltransferase family 2 protein [Paenibacillus roseus]
MQLTSIVIPSCDGLILLKGAVAAIRNFTCQEETPYEIIIADDGSRDGTAEWCREEGLRFVSLPYNSGFPAACNKGMRMASGEYILLLNHDVTVTVNWLANLHRALASECRIGMVGPVTNYASGRQQVEGSYTTMEEFQKLAVAVNTTDPDNWEETPRLAGLCLLFTRSFYDHVGDLDERFSPGYYVDDDVCFRARKLGYKLLICRDALIHHEGSVSFREHDQSHLQALLKRNRELFIEKWQVDLDHYI